MARRALVPLLGALAVLAAGCGGGGQATTATTTTTAAAPAKTGTVWLCFPGKTPDPCSSSMATTVIKANGSKTVETPKAAANPPIDCFYVYPTVSSENQGNSDLQIQLPQIFVAQAQASRFSQVCRVYAPMYRQITDRGLTTPSLHASPLLTYTSLRSAWQDYLAHYNHGRGVVLIGHSQGAYVLKALTKRVIDKSPAQRRLLVSEILLGGQVLSANGATDTGDFKHVPPCASATATGCVIAYSSFDTVPPAHARFGRTASTTTHVLCVNPAEPGSSASLPVTPLFPTIAFSFLGERQHRAEGFDAVDLLSRALHRAMQALGLGELAADRAHARGRRHPSPRAADVRPRLGTARNRREHRTREPRRRSSASRPRRISRTADDTRPAHMSAVLCGIFGMRFARGVPASQTCRGGTRIVSRPCTRRSSNLRTTGRRPKASEPRPFGPKHGPESPSFDPMTTPRPR